MNIFRWILLAFSLMTGGVLWGHTVYIVPIKGQIDSPQLYILRRALKQAIQEKGAVIVLDMDTPGGSLSTTLKMMEALNKFEGHTLTFVNSDAISAGSYIATATDEIYFAPNGIMGAAAAIQSTGGDIDATLKQKIDSYLRAKVRSLSAGHRYRASVQRAMMDEDYVLEIDGQILKDKGELLSLTASEAVKRYGEPPEPLLAESIVESIDQLLAQRYGSKFIREDFQITWIETLAKWLTGIAPVLMGGGLLLLFIEFKTPGFGVFGVVGIGLLLLVFASHYLAALAGYEPLLIFVFGFLLLSVEIFLVPGTIVAGTLGIVVLLGSLVWAMTDIWPMENFSMIVSSLWGPVHQVVFGVFIAFFGALLIGRFMPRSWFWDRIVLQTAVPSTPVPQVVAEGQEGIAITDLHPSGEVEIEGRRYQAKTSIGDIGKGTVVVVVDRHDFCLIVRRADKKW